MYICIYFVAMGKFNVGDKVCFLNAQGKGVVRKIVDSQTVEVEMEDGFAVPVVCSDLVLDYRTIHASSVSSTPMKSPATPSVVITPQPEPEHSSKLHKFGRDAEPEGLYLAFIPHDQQWLLRGDIDISVVNHTPADALYTFNIKKDNLVENVNYGSIAPYSQTVVETISRDEIEQWCDGFVQMILSEESSKHYYKPLHAPFSLRTARFFKDGSFVPSGILGKKALMINLSSISVLQMNANEKLEFSIDDIGSKSGENPTIVNKEPALIDRHRTARGEAVVDLHIEQLVDDVRGMSNNEIFSKQINYFRQMLDSAIVEEYHKVTFIHGVGNGVLRDAIVKELKNKDNVSSQMASLLKYGVGAIDIFLNNK